MAYKLFDPLGKELTYHDLQDKGLWCIAGASKEETFVRLYGERLNLIIHPEKASNRYGPDLLNTANGLPGDLKTQNTPFFQAQERFQMPPQFVVVFNGKDRERYSQLYPNIEIYFAVDWQAVRFETWGKAIAVQPMAGVWKISFPALQELLKKAPFHSYQQRMTDQKGNAKGSYVLDLRQPGFNRVV